MELVIETSLEYQLWIKQQLILQQKTQKEIADQLGIPPTRISEAIHLKPGGKKYIIPLIRILGGDTDCFHKFLQDTLRNFGQPSSTPSQEKTGGRERCTADVPTEYDPSKPGT